LAPRRKLQELPGRLEPGAPGGPCGRGQRAHLVGHRDEWGDRAAARGEGMGPGPGVRGDRGGGVVDHQAWCTQMAHFCAV